MSDRELLEMAPALAEWKTSERVLLHEAELESERSRLWLTLQISETEDLRYPGVAKMTPRFCVSASLDVFGPRDREIVDRQTFILCTTESSSQALKEFSAALERAMSGGEFTGSSIAPPTREEIVARFVELPQSAEYQLNRLFS